MAAGCEATAPGLRRVWAPQERAASLLLPHGFSSTLIPGPPSWSVPCSLPSVSVKQPGWGGSLSPTHCVPGTLKALWRDFPGGPVAKTLSSQLREVWVRSLVRELEPTCSN